MKNKSTMNTDPTEIIQIFNQITGRRFTGTKKHLSVIESVLKQGYSTDEISAVILTKFLEWKDSPVMAVHICPITIFRLVNFEKYANQVAALKANPELLKIFNEKYNPTANSSAGAFAKFDEMFGK